MKTKSKALALILAVITVFTMSASASAYVMSERYMTVYYGKAVQLHIDKDLTMDDVTFVSSDERIASVDENGLVTSNGVGNCTITCTNNETGESDECEIHVELLWWKMIENILYFLKNLVR